MKSKIIAVSIILLFGSAALAQTTPTPTLEQCRANYVAWDTSKATSADKLFEFMKPLSQATLFERATAMSACVEVAGFQHGKGRATHQDFIEFVQYESLSKDYWMFLTLRYKAYLMRHDEINQFIREDAAGKRFGYEKEK
jgi:hypothetical protein